MVVGVFDLAQIITVAESTQELRAHGFGSGNDEVGMPAENFDEGGAVVEAGIDQK